jgi:hypothetical protein
VFVAAFSVFCGVASVDYPSFSVGLLSAAVTGLGMPDCSSSRPPPPAICPTSSAGVPVRRPASRPDA